jgi:phosphoribosylanthranilate isomerase
MNSALGARGKRRLNRVFDAIGFIYPDYCFPARKRGLKRKSALKASSAAPKQKKVKVLTHRSQTYYLERAAELPTLSY